MIDPLDIWMTGRKGSGHEIKGNSGHAFLPQYSPFRSYSGTFKYIIFFKSKYSGSRILWRMKI